MASRITTALSSGECSARSRIIRPGCGLGVNSKQGYVGSLYLRRSPIAILRGRCREGPDAPYPPPARVTDFMGRGVRTRLRSRALCRG